jgi:hypothetical protein
VGKQPRRSTREVVVTVLIDLYIYIHTIYIYIQYIYILYIYILYYIYYIIYISYVLGVEENGLQEFIG